MRRIGVLIRRDRSGYRRPWARAGGRPCRPGGLTGVTAVGTELTGKRLELLHQLVPAADPIAMLGGAAGTELMKAETKAMQAAASALGLRLLVLSAVSESEVAASFATIVEQQQSRLDHQLRSRSRW